MWHGETTGFRLRRVFNQLLNLMYPEDRPLCLVCKRPMDRVELENSHMPPGVCVFCLQSNLTAVSSPVIGKLRLETGKNFAVVCAAQYDGWLRDAIRHWKYDGTLKLTNWFAARMAQTLTSAIPESQRRWDCIVPVPTAPDRIHKRGYDHVGLLATSLGSRLSLPVAPLLARQPNVDSDDTQLTRSQTTRSATERLAALQGQFALSPLAARCQGKRLLLVDDVVTTGATLQACGNVLSKLHPDDLHGAALAYVQ